MTKAAAVTGNSTLTLTPTDSKLLARYIRIGVAQEALEMQRGLGTVSKEQADEAATHRARALGYAEFLVMER